MSAILSAAGVPPPLPPLDQTDTYLLWKHQEGPGWNYLLPPVAGRRLLCLDAAGGAVAWSLARESAQVTLLTAGAAWPAPDRDPGQPAAALAVVELDALLKRPGAQAFDGIVIHDPFALRVNGQSRALLQALLAATARLLQPDGWVYLAVANRHSPSRWLKRLRRRGNPHGEPASTGRLAQWLRRAGLPHLRRHPLLLDNGRVAEVIPPGGYHATKNREARGERLKEALLGPHGAPRLAPAVALLACRKAGTRSRLDDLLARVAPLRGTSGAPAVLKQYLVFSGHKAIVSAGPADRDDQDVVAVLTADMVSTRGRALEAPHLQALAQIPAVAPCVPRLLDRFAFGQATCFVLQRMPGVTIDQDLPVLEKVTHASLDFLLHLHRETAMPTRLDESGHALLVEPMLAAVCERNPHFAPTVQGWRAPLARALRGAVLPAVVQHGDFKVENVIYEPHSCRVLSVIDWELARRPGLPVLDLMYLLLYNRIIRGALWHEALEQVIVHDGWTADERARLMRYLQAFAIEPRLLPALRALFMAHHLGCRIHLSAASPLVPRIGDMFRALQAQLASQTA